MSNLFTTTEYCDLLRERCQLVDFVIDVAQALRKDGSDLHNDIQLILDNLNSQIGKKV